MTHTILFLDVSELCSKVLPEEMKDVEWNVVRTANPVHFDITTGLMGVGVSPQLGEKTGSEFMVDVPMQSFGVYVHINNTGFLIYRTVYTKDIYLV